MRVLPPPLDLSIAGFTADDLFGRRRLAEGLKNLVGVSEDPLVIALDGQWGAGKTTFLAMWADLLKHEGFPVIRFDAFEHDYVEDPFLAIAGEIIALAERLAPAKEEERKALVAKTKAAGKIILRHGAGAGLKLITLGALDAVKAADEIAEAVADAVKEASDTYLEEVLTTHTAQREILSRFREALRALPALINPPVPGESQKPLIFIIDELDRCRPIFALQTLERIKHFFAVENVHFVLGVNLAQLRTSIAAAYGVGVDAGVYLQKFVHFTFHLTTGEGANSGESYRRFVDVLLKRLNFPVNRLDAARAAAEIIARASARLDVNLRGIERMMMTLALAMAFQRGQNSGPPAILGGLCVLKVQEPDMYAKAKRGALIYREVAPIFGFPDMARWSESHDEWDEAGWWWAICASGGYDGQVQAFISDRFARSGLKANMAVPWVANEVIDRLQPT